MAKVYVSLELDIPDSNVGIDPLDDILCGAYGSEAQSRREEEIEEDVKTYVVANWPRLLSLVSTPDREGLDVEF